MVVANHYDSSTYSLDSEIYRWNGTLFEPHDSIATHGASGWEFFTIDGEHYLVVANSRQDSDYTIDSIIYRWNGATFVSFSAFASSGAADWEYFTMNGEHYLALANRYNGSTYNQDSKIYHWNGSFFNESQTIPTSGATDWAFVTVEQQPYLFVSNSRDDSTHNVASQLYQWNEVQTAFVAEHSIATEGAVDGAFFAIGSQSYLAVANENDGSTYNLDSRLYEFSASSTLLGIYALAFDTKPIADLTWAYTDTIQGLLSTTNQAANKTAIVVVDMPGEENTSVLEIRNGQQTVIQGLPDASGELSTTLREYDMTDGATLGGFLLWARNTYPADQTIFSYVGHGGPLIPETDYSRIFENNNRYPEGRNELFPLPLRTDATPEFTDITPESKFLSVYQLSEALRIGTDEGSHKFAVLDLVHCFASTIEEYYGASPYAESMIGSPNYAFFAPEMPGQALNVADPNQSAQLMAQGIVSRYESLLASYDRPETSADDHPRLLVAVDSSKISEIKQKWDDLSANLWANFDRTKLETAYRNSAHYDTTYCEPQDWALASPDAVVDLGTFATQLGQEFGAPVSDTVDELLLILNQAVIERHAQAGDPWFAEVSQTWRFDDNAGIGLYADLVGKSDGGESYLSWHARFYTDTVTSDNIHPYSFLQNSASGRSWADIFYKFWQDHPNANIQTSGCLPYLAPVPRSGTANLALTMSDDPDPVVGQQPLTYELSVSNFGPDSATEVVVSDTLPSAVNFASSTASQGSCQEAAGLVTCNLGSLPDGESASITIVVTPTRQVTLSNRAEVSSATADTFLANNMASQETKILDESADLEITISDSFDPVLANNELVYQVTVHNHGPITASSVTIRNTLPENVTFVSAIPSQRNNCTPSGRAVTCDLGSVPNGHTVKVDITVIPNTTGRLTNVANVESFTPDSNEENNAVQEQTIVNGEGMSINEVTPGYGFNNVPSLLYIHGFGFEQPLNVTLGGEQLNVIHDELVRIIAVVPSGLAPGLYDVTVNTSSHSATAGDAYQVLGAEDNIGDLLSLPEWLWSEPHPLRVGYTDSGVGLKIQHLGGSSPLDSVTVEFRRDGPNGALLGSSQMTEPLAPDAIGSSGKVVLDPPPQEAGDYTVCAIIDPDKKVQETDETNNVICRTLTVLPQVEDEEPPEVPEFLIADDDESTAQITTTLAVTATDYPIPGASGVRAIRFFEFEYILGARRWVQVKRSEWIDYATAQTNYPWSLVPTFGIRYMQAWAEDHAGIISLEPGEDMIDLLPSEQDARVEQHGVVFYRIYLEEGESFSATLTPKNGDPDLYVWGASAQPWKSENSFTEIDTVQFKAPTKATYQIEVHGREASDYRLQFGTATAAQIRSWRAQDNPEKQSPGEPAVPLDQVPQHSAPPPPQPQEPQEPETYTIYLPITTR